MPKLGMPELSLRMHGLGLIMWQARLNHGMLVLAWSAEHAENHVCTNWLPVTVHSFG